METSKTLVKTSETSDNQSLGCLTQVRTHEPVKTSETLVKTSETLVKPSKTLVKTSASAHCCAPLLQTPVKTLIKPLQNAS